ncbi:DIE2/ALG10 family-domain-containing protein [Trichophaea hybrida]|nr:DIE2/ALG10 family-domain-containing protein [Trichophaea hybrida]
MLWKLEEIQWEDSEKGGERKLEVGMFLDPRRWGEVKIHNPLLTNDTKFTDYLLTPITLLPSFLHNLPTLLAALIPYTLVLFSFALFLAYNNFTVVLGDASAHQASLHLPQLLYFTAATAFFSFPLYLPLRPTIFSFLPPSPKATLSIFLSAAAIAAIVHTNTILHPYLLADNRHYSFYIFRRILLRFPPYSLFAPIPVYIFAAWLQRLALSADVAWCLLYVFAIAATLVGAPLVEPRYFVIAWVMWRMHVRERRMWVLWMEAAWFVVVNCVTLYLFLYKSFEWVQEEGRRQRFMW